MSQIAKAIEGFKQVLNETQIVQDHDRLQRYARDTSVTTRQIPLVLLPESVQEIVELVKIASQYGVALYPVSKGNNWGYGSAMPVVNQSVVMDLSRMDKIIDFDREFGVVTIEPGVTQKILSEFLIANGNEFMTPVTGSGPEGSILGNALERGYGITPIADHFSALLSLEAVLPDGSIYHSALYEKGCQTIDKIFKWGIGPYIDGIFTQGNFGIVTKITIQLAVYPEKVGAFIFEMKDERDLEKTVVLIRETLRELGGVAGSINLMNALRLLSMSAPYPFSRIQKSQKVFVEELEAMAGEMSFAPWTCLGSFYGKREVVQAAIQLLKEKIYPHSKRLIFLSRPQLIFLESILSILPGSWKNTSMMRIQKMKMSFDILEGRPSKIALPLCYRKMAHPPREDEQVSPSQDGCGLLWYAPLVPMKSDLVRRYVEFVRSVCIKHAIEPLITLTSVSDRCFDSTVPILFDPQNSEDTHNAVECYRELLKQGQSQGFYPYRAHIDMMKEVVDLTKPFWITQKKIKDAIDPQGIIAPGRYSYDFETSHPQYFPS